MMNLVIIILAPIVVSQGSYCQPGKNYFHKCKECFCNGLVDACRSSDLYYNKLATNFREPWAIHDLRRKIETATLNINSDGALEFRNVRDFPNQDLFFVAPREFTGNKVSSFVNKK